MKEKKVRITQDYLSGYEEGRKLNYSLEKRKLNENTTNELINKTETGMKVISMGLGKWNVFDKSLKVSNKLPSLVYRVEFDPQQGFYLQEEPFIYVSEKIYGKHKNTAKLMIEGFEKSDRNMGIILSGEKGLGKSLIAKYLCQEMLERGYPVIIITQYIEGLNNFFRTIQQNVVVYLDEFDKIFKNNTNSINKFQNEFDSQPIQDKLLSLLDGTSIGKNMFLLTCNNIFDLSSYLLNRTGRCHYHIRFDYPDSSDIEEYLKDNLNSINKDEINQVIEFANKVKLNYDSLRSICFELNLGREFKDIIGILNILNVEATSMEISLRLNDGTECKTINKFVLDKNRTIRVDFIDKQMFANISLRSLAYKDNHFFLENPEEDVKINKYNYNDELSKSDKLYCKDCQIRYCCSNDFNYLV